MAEHESDRGGVASDPEYEQLKSRHLPMLSNEVGSDEYVLDDPGTSPTGDVDPGPLRDEIIAALKTVYDPEIPVNIYDLGLVYELDVADDGAVHVQMTLTAPGCPVAGPLVREVHDKVRSIRGVKHTKTELVWEPPWTQERLSDEAKLELGLF